jgi:UDPglucose 6-dehydrogenase
MTHIAVYGLGKLGTGLACVLSTTHTVTGIDPIEPPANFKEPKVNLDAVTYSSVPVAADMSFIVVPTPSLSNGKFDHTYVERALGQISEVNDKGHTAVIVSTVMPGTCANLQIKFTNLHLVYNPTFIALGSVVNDLMSPDMLLIGGPDITAVGRVQLVWEMVFQKQDTCVYPSPTRSNKFVDIELLKLSVNCALATKIALANSLGQLYKAYGASPMFVQHLGDDDRLGRGFWTPGAPLGGPCLPRDNIALRAAGNEFGIAMPFSSAVINSDWEHKSRILDLITEEPKKSVGILGMSYKYGVPVAEGSFGAWLRQELEYLEIPWKAYDTVLEGYHSLADVLACERIVVCHRELRGRISTEKAIDIWT